VGLSLSLRIDAITTNYEEPLASDPFWQEDQRLDNVYGTTSRIRNLITHLTGSVFRPNVHIASSDDTGEFIFEDIHTGIAALKELQYFPMLEAIIPLLRYYERLNLIDSANSDYYTTRYRLVVCYH